VDSWDGVIKEARRLFDAKWEADRVEMQDEHDYDPADYMKWPSRADEVVDGKVIDPWSPCLTRPCRWWLDNVTLTGVWLYYQHMQDTAHEAVLENLAVWADGETDGDPMKAVSKASEEAINSLDKAIEKANKDAADEVRRNGPLDTVADLLTAP
jgi:hypothetical protein